MATATGTKNLNPVSWRGDKIVRRLDDFPELVEALRDGDLLTGRMFCARIFDLDLRPTLRNGEQAPTWQCHVH